MAHKNTEQEKLNQLRAKFKAEPEDMENAISLAELYSDLGWISESEEIYSILAKKYPDNYSIQLAYGNICYNKNLRQEALQIFNKLTIMKPDRVEGWNNLGIIQMESDDLEGAKSSFEKVLEIEPSNHGALLNLGNYYNITDNNKKALECFRQVTEYRPDFKDGWYNYGNSLLNEKRFEEARDAFMRSLKYDPLFISALKNLGYSYEKLCNFEKAIEFYLKALEQNRTDPTLYSNIANVYKQMDKLDESEDYFQKSVKVAPRESAGWAGLRELSLLMGNLDTYLKSSLAILHRLSSDEVAETCKILRLCGWQKGVSQILKAADKLKKNGNFLDSERLLEYQSKSKNIKIISTLYKKLKLSDNKSDDINRSLMEYAFRINNWQDIIEFYNNIKTKQYIDKINYAISLFDCSKGSAVAKIVDELFTQNKFDSESWFLKSLYILLFKKNEEEAIPYLKIALIMGFSQIELIRKYDSMDKLYKSLMEVI